LVLRERVPIGIVLRVGSSGPAYTEVVEGELSDGDLVVIGETSSQSP